MKLGDVPYGCHYRDGYGMIWLKTLESKDLANTSASILIYVDKARLIDLVAQDRCADMRLVDYLDNALIYYHGSPLEVGSRHLELNSREVEQLEVDFWQGENRILSTLT